MSNLNKYVFILAFSLCPLTHAQQNQVQVQDEGTQATLSDAADVRTLIQELTSGYIRENVERLTTIDQTYSDGVTATSRENSERLTALFQKQRDDLSALQQLGLDLADRNKRTELIQEELASGRAALTEWYNNQIERLKTEHANGRSTQQGLHSDLISHLQEKQRTVIEQLKNGPISSGALLSEIDAFRGQLQVGQSSTIGISEPVPNSSDVQTIHTGGVDVAGTVPTDALGEEIVANANQERFALFERLFYEEKERRERAEEEAANRLEFTQTFRAQANTRASTPAPNCEAWPLGDGPDADWDGVVDSRCGGADCDDSDPNRYPGNTEVADSNGHDEDCDPTTFGNRDEDNDGFVPTWACNGDNCGTDCDDLNASTYPGASEVCNYIDDNCDGKADEGVYAVKYLDRDGDTHGDAAASLRVCAQTYQSPYGEGEWLSGIGNDCDDTDPSTWNDCSDENQ